MDKLQKEQIFKAIDLIAEQNLLTKEETKKVITDSVEKAFHSKYDPDAELEVIIDEKNKKFELYNNTKMVVDDSEFNPEYNAIEIKLSDAKKIKKGVAAGDFVREEVNFAAYSKQIARQIRQMFTQSIREKKKEAVYAKHKGLKGEMIEAIATTVTPSHAIFQLDDGAAAFMPAQLRNPNIQLKVGERVKVYVEDILEDSKDAQIIVSNGSKELIKRILEEEVPEISSGLVEIMSISRQPGVRSKVAVKSNQDNIDPVGTIIGAQGVRISAILKRLEGEKIDVIPYSPDINIFIANALSPAKVAAVIDKEDSEGQVIEKTKIAIVPNNQQTLAIGKRGSNVRLAVELVSSRIDVVSIDQAKEQGLSYELNVGLTQEDIEKIEQGIKVGGFRRRQDRSEPNIASSEFEDSIKMFNDSILEEETTTEDINVDEDLFSEDELKKMEADFEFDEELQNFENELEEDEE